MCLLLTLGPVAYLLNIGPLAYHLFTLGPLDLSKGYNKADLPMVHRRPLFTVCERLRRGAVRE